MSTPSNTPEASDPRWRTVLLIAVVGAAVLTFVFAKNLRSAVGSPGVTKLSMPAADCPVPKAGQMLFVMFEPIAGVPGKLRAECHTVKAGRS